MGWIRGKMPERRTRSGLGLRHELALVGRSTMRLKDQSQMLHRLIRRIVETKPRVGMCRHYLDAGRGSHQTAFSLLRAVNNP